jgi:FixJ family two-component response regulator
MPIIFITGHGDIPMSVKAMKAGADDFLSKPFDGDRLLAAVQSAVIKDAGQAAMRAERCALVSRYRALTPRERETFAYLITGMLNKQIAAELGITERTVKAHRSSILHKFGVYSIAELVRIAAKLGIQAADVES